MMSKLIFPKLAALVLCLITTSLACQAQRKRDWHPGNITFKDGHELSGKLYYKIEEEALLLQEADSFRTFRPVDVHAFQIQQRDSFKTFYALPFDLNEDNSPTVFFQLLKELPDFWVLSRKAPKEKIVISTYGNPNGVPSSQTFRNQTEMIFFLTNDGKVTLYHSSAELMARPALSEKRKTVKANIAFLQQLTDPYYTKLVEYADNAGLDFENAADLLIILEYYVILAGS